MLLKRLLFATAMSAGLVLGGCTTVEGWFTSGSPQATAAQQDAEKALTAIASIHDAVALSASAAAKSGACINDCATKVKSYLDGSEKLILDAKGLTNPVDIMADITAATALIADAKGLL